MIKFLALVALAALASGGTLSRKLPRGVFPWSPSGRIVGGEATRIEQVPHQISLRVRGRHSCGGSIISKYWIVTAAHCVGQSMKYYTVNAGSGHRTSGGSSHTVAQIVAHENFGLSIYGVPYNDIALVRINEPFEFDETRQPIVLFNAFEETTVGRHALITGWGLTASEGRLSSILRIVKVPIVSKEVCNDAYGSWGGIPEGQICAAYPEGGKDACQGDSGGPFSVDGRLAGIVSWGNGCAVAGYPGAYTEIAAYRDWIKFYSGV